jgi:hypothetical protein
MNAISIAVGGIVLASAVTLAGLHYTGVVDATPMVKTAQKIGEDFKLVERAPRYTLVGIDVTSGREQELEKDREAVAKLIEVMVTGDRVEVYLIHGQAESAQQRVFQAGMPEAEGPVGQALARERQKAIREWQECWESKVIAATRSTQSNRTDLFGFCRFAGSKQGFRSHKAPSLVLLTDAQQVGDGLNMERKIPTEGDLERLKQQHMLPSLTGIRVVMAGVTPTHSISNAHWRGLRSFWEEYLKTSGAASVEFSSERNLTDS